MTNVYSIATFTIYVTNEDAKTEEEAIEHVQCILDFFPAMMDSEIIGTPKKLGFIYDDHSDWLVEVSCTWDIT